MSQSRPTAKHAQHNHPRPVSVKVGQKFPLTIKRLGINGEGIGYFKRKITFVPGALPGEVITAKVTAVNPKYLEARLVTVRTPSPDRVSAPKTEDGVGGLELAHLAYPAQLAFKEDLIRQALEKFQPRNWQPIPIKKTLGMDQPDHYRNKAQFPVRRVGDQVRIGMYKRGSHDLVDLTDSPTQDATTMAIINQMRTILTDLDLSIYDEKRNRGDLKAIVVRANQDGQAQLTLVTNRADFPGSDQLVAAIRREIPTVTGIFQNINPGKISLMWGDETRKLWGADYLNEEILGLNFALSPRAFLQLNYQQMLLTYETAIAALDPKPGDRLVDAYAGVGTLGLSMANYVQEVRGMEIIPEAVADAQQNARDNGIENAHYEVGLAEELLPEWQQGGFKPNALIVDPPRAGLDSRLRRAIIYAKPEKFVYISCNPATLARDLVDLSQAYDVDYIQPIDMFPQTPRWEGVVKLHRR
ncbi:23S rRNA (uracil(1939)-C(5))-methyltransferase RlmD [Lactobacillaceae bacterium L1_55_11]|nr:23S rRNA (uracil(1939)-C(5))-methyltransferase RlmD [Lactobacillaceae bacterium L1_55_11]